MPQTALARLHALWDAGQYRQALHLAAGWPRLGAHRDAIQRGWAAAYTPKFYRELGHDPVALYRAGLAAVAARYSLDMPPVNPPME